MDIYIILLVVLFALAISDLVVGVSNDAVNFLVSAIGSKAAPFWTIMGIASLGVLVGATFSSGMMEVARKSIFHPEHFMFSEIMIIFLAVMLTDIILLDLFNTFGMPTSTTVSIVFELLGAAVAISVIKISNDSSLHIGDYINTAKALLIIAGILLSVVVAFSAGALVQYITRLFFSFDIAKSYKYYGALWGGIAITSITYFILIKGLKGTSYANEVVSDGVVLKEWVQIHAFGIIASTFVVWTLVMQVLVFFKVNILKIIVLVGTFALAMAFAGNDLVNFIGVPLAGLRSYETFVSSGISPEAFSMEGLAAKVATPTVYLLIAGLVMVVTLWFSKKARSVTQTSLNLSRQDSGYERFGSSMLSRVIVRNTISVSNQMKEILPEFVLAALSKQFDRTKETMLGDDEKPAFDLVRASVNLTVASILISFGTSLKLPLSTTYVTFMVAMGTSLADGAWGRESAVYRITGVLSVISGWFFTAFIAFSVSFIFASLIHWGGHWVIFAILAFALYLIFKTQKIHKNREAEMETDEIPAEDVKEENIFERCSISVSKILLDSQNIYKRTIVGLSSENRHQLKAAVKDVEKLDRNAKRMKDDISTTILMLQDDSIETGHFYVQVLDYLREIAHALSFVTKPSFDYVDNQHTGLLESQIENLYKLTEDVHALISDVLQIIKENNFETVDNLLEKQHEILLLIKEYRKLQIKRIKRQEVGTRNSMLFLNILTETKTIMLNVINLVKSQRDFVIYQES